MVIGSLRSVRCRPDVFSQLSGIRRRFKVFKVNGETGEVISMKIREVEHVE